MREVCAQTDDNEILVGYEIRYSPQIARHEGVPGFYRGFGAILITVVPANMCYFS